MISLREGTINLIHGIHKMSKLLITGLEVNQFLDQPQNLTNPRNGSGDPVIMLNMGIQEIILVNRCQVKMIMAKTGTISTFYCNVCDLHFLRTNLASFSSLIDQNIFL